MSLLVSVIAVNVHFRISSLQKERDAAVEQLDAQREKCERLESEYGDMSQWTEALEMYADQRARATAAKTRDACDSSASGWSEANNKLDIEWPQASDDTNGEAEKPPKAAKLVQMTAEEFKDIAKARIQLRKIGAERDQLQYA